MKVKVIERDEGSAVNISNYIFVVANLVNTLAINKWWSCHQLLRSDDRSGALRNSSRNLSSTSPNSRLMGIREVSQEQVPKNESWYHSPIYFKHNRAVFETRDSFVIWYLLLRPDPNISLSVCLYMYLCAYSTLYFVFCILKFVAMVWSEHFPICVPLFVGDSVCL